jgi:hypothetical protein
MDDLNQPATKADLRDLEQRMKSNFSYLSDYLDKILAVVNSMDRRLTPELTDHEGRIKRLEIHSGLRLK